MSVQEEEGRRQLRFSSIEELEAELARIDSAEREGRLRTVGNWTPGQIFNHLAAWIEFAYDGYPVKESPLPLVVRVLMGPVLRSGRRWFLGQPFLDRPASSGHRVSIYSYRPREVGRSRYCISTDGPRNSRWRVETT